MVSEWLLVSILIATPFVIFAAIEAYGYLRRRKAQALATRSKSSGSREREGGR